MAEWLAISGLTKVPALAPLPACFAPGGPLMYRCLTLFLTVIPLPIKESHKVPSLASNTFSASASVASMSSPYTVKYRYCPE